MSEKTDFAMMISSDLIAEVMGRYFNEEMFKRQVKIVDLKSAEDGYVFSLAFDSTIVDTPVTVHQWGIEVPKFTQDEMDMINNAKPVQYPPVYNGQKVKRRYHKKAKV